MITDVAMLHPTINEAVGEWPPESVAHAELGNASSAGKVADGKLVEIFSL